MSDTMAPEKVEAVVITGPDRGRIIEIPAPEPEPISDADLRLLNQALDRVLDSLDRFGRQLDKTTQALENRSRR
jgi:hypothetical protein